MTRRAVAHLEDALWTVLERHRMEYRLTNAEVVGVLALMQAEVTRDALEPDRGDDDGGEGVAHG